MPAFAAGAWDSEVIITHALCVSVTQCAIQFYCALASTLDSRYSAVQCTIRLCSAFYSALDGRTVHCPAIQYILQLYTALEAGERSSRRKQARGQEAFRSPPFRKFLKFLLGVFRTNLQFLQTSSMLGIN